MASSISSKSAPGTLRSLGRQSSGGVRTSGGARTWKVLGGQYSGAWTDVSSPWYVRAYSQASNVRTGCLENSCVVLFCASDRSSQGLVASRVPTCIHSLQSAASEIQAPESTLSSL